MVGIKKKEEEARLGNPLGYKPIGRLLLEFSIPATISILVNSIYNIVDQIFIGQGVGTLGNAATTVVFPIMTIVMAVSTMLGSGGCAYASIKMGEKKEGEVNRTLNNTFAMALASSIVMAIIGLIFMEPLLRLFGTSDTVMPYAKDYAFVILLGTPASVLGPCLSSMARTDGKPRLSMYGILIGAVLNTILDPIYIFVFHWGVLGAALATVLSQVISAVVLTVYFAKFSKHMRLKFRDMLPKGKVCKMILALGASSGITQAVACVMQIVMNNSLKHYGDMTSIGGDTAQSSMGIVLKIMMILASICIGIGIGSQPITGFNFGARQYHRIKKLLVISMIAATISAIVGCGACELFPAPIAHLFGGGKDPVFMEFTVKCLRIFLAASFCIGFQIIATSYFQATGQPLKSSILSMLRQLIILVPMMLILPLFMGLDGVLWAGPCADIGSALIVACFMIPEYRKLNRLIKENPVDPVLPTKPGEAIVQENIATEVFGK